MKSLFLELDEIELDARKLNILRSRKKEGLLLLILFLTSANSTSK